MVEVPCAPARVGLLARCRLARRSRGCNGCQADCGCNGGCSDGCGDGCGDDCGCAPQTTTVCKKVWVPNLVTKEVPVTVCKTVMEEQPYEYCVTVCKPETRTCKVRSARWSSRPRPARSAFANTRRRHAPRPTRSAKWFPQQISKEVTYTVCVPKTVTKTYQVTVCKCVPYEKEVTYTVCVPHQVQKEVDVRVCKMVPTTVTVPACTSGCGHSCTRGCRLHRRSCCATTTNCSTDCGCN